jgi:DNA-binding SARP family transcriptional activator
MSVKAVPSDAPAAMTVMPVRASPEPTRTRLTLLGGFELTDNGEPVVVPMSAQRVIAFIALHDHPLQRAYVAGSLWLDSPEARAHANLRSALWRLGRRGCALVDTREQQLRIDADVAVDVRDVETSIRRMLVGGDVALNASLLGADLLPDWYDDWVELERERFRQLRLHALEVLCERLTEAGRLGEALDTGLAAVAAEPLRESAHRALVRVHLAEGNTAEALRQYRLFRRLLREQLGLEPSAQIEQLLRPIARSPAGSFAEAGA